MRTPKVMSPYALIQEFYRDDPWKLLVCVIMLNLTSAKQVWPLVGDFFQKYPDCFRGSEADPDEMAQMLSPLGLNNRRARTIIKMSRAYADGSFEDPDELPGIGKYGADSYNIFVRGQIIEDVADKKLRLYVDWAKGLEIQNAE